MITFLPILRRELAVAARRTATYRQRVIFGAIATLTVAVLFMFSPVTRLKGTNIFHFVSWAGFILSLLEGLRVAADTISLERREGTLGLLLLTDARGYDVVVAKIGSASVQALTTVISMLPAFSLPLLMGGVTAGECWRVVLSLLAALFVALGAGILVSTLTTSALAAFSTALFGVLALMLPAVAAVLLPTNALLGSMGWVSGPLQMLIGVPEPRFLSSPFVFWRATFAAAIFCGLLFAVSALLLHRFPRLEPVQQDSLLQRWLRPRPGRSEAWDGSSARTSPAVWLAERTLPGRQSLWVIVIVGVASCFVAGWFGGRTAVLIAFACEVAFAFLIKLWVAAVAPLSLNSSRRNGALELLLCTPISTQEVVRGQVDALYSYFLGPGLIIGVGFAVATVIGMGLGQNSAGMRSDGSWFAFGLFWFALFILDLHALAYTGLWFGLTNARVDRAIAKTVFCVLILPWITLVIPVAGCVGLLAWPIFWINWSSRRLRLRFRSEAVKQFAATDDAGWFTKP